MYVSRDETSRVTGDDPGKLAGTRELLSDGKFSANSQIGGGEAQASCACDRQSAGEKREKGRSGERPGSQGEESDEGTTVPFAFCPLVDSVVGVRRCSFARRPGLGAATVDLCGSQRPKYLRFGPIRTAQFPNETWA